MRQDDKRTAVVLSLIGIVPVIWLALKIAPAVGGGLAEILPMFMNIFDNPFHIELCEDSLKTVLVLLLSYGMGIGIYFSTRRNYRRREEHGSAKWGEARTVNKKYAQHPKSANKLMTQNVSIGLDAKKHRRNLNTLVCGGSGAGKTRFFCKPNLMQANTSFVVLDPKGEILRDVGRLLESKGYIVKVLDLISMQKSHCYNPFVYLQNDNDVQRLVTNLFKSTTPKGSQSNDPFWDTAASMLLMALIFYLHYEAPEDEQNFSMVLEMLRAGAIENEEEPRPSPLDNLFSELEYENPEHIAVKYYNEYHGGSAKTLKSIQITLAARLEKFNLDSLAALTMTDELELNTLGEEKTALFALIPDNDTSFNFLVSILYTQLFQQLFYSADHVHGGSLPIPVHFLMDEFANVSLPDDFDKILSVMRSRGVSVSIILQNLAQLKALFEKQWESIVGNCDEFLYLGGNEQSTHKYVSELLGKSTIDTNTYGKSSGRNGNYSTNFQLSGRELLTSDEVRMLDNRYAILFIRGERPVLDFKSISNELIYGSVHGIKKDEDGNGLGGATIGLYAAGGAEPILTTESADDGSFSFENVPYGDYVIKEIEAPTGYVLDSTPHSVKIDKDGAVVDIELTNTIIRGSVQLTKVDKDYPDNHLSGAEFEVYKDGKSVGKLEELSDGVYKMDNLEYGEYTLRETKAPDRFYLDEKTYSFSIKENGATVIVENEAGKGFINEAQTGSLRIEKTSEDGKLQGFTFKVEGTDITGNAFSKTYVTDENGQINIDGLRIGDYVVSEVANDATKAYVLPDNVTVTVHAEKTVVAKFHNKLIPETPDVPKTGDSTNMTLWAVLAGASLVGAGITAFFTFRKRKETGRHER